MQKFEYFFPLSLSVSVCLRADFIWLVGNSKLAAVKFVHFLSVARRRKNWCCWWNIPSHSVSSLHIPTIERPFVHQKKPNQILFKGILIESARTAHTHREREICQTHFFYVQFSFGNCFDLGTFDGETMTFLRFAHHLHTHTPHNI